MIPGKRPVKVVQFGEGNFLRAFIDWMFDITNEKGLTNAGVALVQPLAGGMCRQIAAQGGDYHLLLRGVEGGRTVEILRRITSVSDALNPYEDPHAFLALAENPELELIVSNTTEAGIAYDPSVTVDAVPAASFPGKLAQLLWNRFKAFSGAPDKGVVMMPCELIDRNGDNLRAVVLRHAAEWKLGDAFTAWLSNHCVFLNTLVDRIVPGFPRGEIDAIAEKHGVRDDLLVTAEPFHFFVIEGPKALSERFPFHKAGLDVVWTDDMTPYRDRKVRILNGCHTMTVAAALLSGVDTVGEALNTGFTRAFLERGLFDEILPTLDLPAEELASYSAAVLERFANPFIRHEWMSISLNSFSKWKTRVQPSLEIYFERRGALPERIVFSLAALIAFYRVAKQTDGSWTGVRGGRTYAVQDDAEVLETLGALWAACDGSPKALEALVSAVLGRTAWWGRDLAAMPGLTAKTTGCLADILNKGMPEALPQV